MKKRNLTHGWMDALAPVARCYSLLCGGPPLKIGLLAALALASANVSQAADSGIYGGGPFYSYANRAACINEIKNSGFTEAIVWNIAVNTSGDLNFNGEFLICSGGNYVGNSTHSDFAGNMGILRGQGTVKRLTFCIGSSNVGDFQDIKSLVNSQGTGSGSILYRNFQALKNAIPALDAIDLDDENCYDQSSMVAFSVMLGNLGYKVSLCPYQNASFWTSVASQVNSQRPGTIDRVHLQCYAGGGGNVPGGVWNFGPIPVYPGLWDANYNASGVQSQMSTWAGLNQYRIAGGWMWLYDDFVGNAAQFASAINNAIGPRAGTHYITCQQNGKVVDNGCSTAQGSGITQYSFNGGQQQRWIFTQNPDGSFKIISQFSGYLLNDPGASFSNGQQMDQWPNSDQSWWVNQQSDGSYQIWNLKSGKVLDNSSSPQDGYPIVQWSWNGGNQQRWLLGN